MSDLVSGGSMSSRFKCSRLEAGLLPDWDTAWTRRLILTFFGRPAFFACVTLLATGSAVCGLLAPYFQKIFVDSLSLGTVHRLEFLSEWKSLMGLAISLWPIAVSLMSLLAGQALVWALRQVSARESAWVQQGLSGEIYRHTLHLHPHSRHGYSVGDLVTYFAQDVSAAGSLVEECLPQILSSLLPLVVAPLAIGLVFDLDFRMVILVAVLGIAVCCFFAWRQAGLFVRYKESTQDRMAVVNEWLQNLKLLRVSGRISAFEQEIRLKRETETARRIAMVTNASAMNACAQVLPQLINLVGLAALISARREALTAGEVFGLLWIFGVFLNLPLRQLPWGLVMAVDGLSSLQRIRSFMREGNTAGNSDESAAASPEKALVSESACALQVEDLKVYSAQGDLLLDVPSFDVRAGEFVAVVGEVGAGKTLLFSALTGEVEPQVRRYTAGQIELTGHPCADWRHIFCLVPQGGFVMNANLRRNLSLEYGDDLPEDATLRKSLLLADFDPERERLPAGLDQPLGERGVNLSGGQRQRLGLARAVQFDRPVVLLDDSLSAVDVETERNLLQTLIMGHWGQKTRILATHRLSALPSVSRTLFLQNGRALGFGTFAQLMSECEEFRSFFEREEEEARVEG